MRSFVTRGVVVVGVLAVSWLVAAAADEEKKKDAGKTTIKAEAVKLGRPVNFQRDIYPILEQNCVACHNVAINEGKLVLEEVKDILKGGKRGTTVVPKQPDKSLLFRVASRAMKPHMPPLPNNQDAKALTPRELGLLRQWILEGAQGGEGQKRMVQFSPLPDSARSIYSVAISPWNRFAASGRTNQVDIFDVALGEQVARLTDPALKNIKFQDKAMYPGGAAHRDFVHSLAFSPDGSLLASGGFRVVKLWQRQALGQQLKLTAPAAVTAMALNADGKVAAVATADNSIRLWNLSDGKPGKVLAGHAAKIGGLDFWPTPQELTQLSAVVTAAEKAVQAAEKNVSLTTQAVKDFDPKTLKLEGDAVAVEKKKRTDAATAAQKAVEAAMAALKKAEEARTVFQKQVKEGSLLVSGSQDKSVRVWKLVDGSPLRQIMTTAPINDVVFSKDGVRIVSAHADNLVRVWTVAAPKKDEAAKKDDKKKKDAKGAEGPKPVLEIKGHTKPVTAVALVQPAGTQIATSSEDATVRIFDLNKGNQVRSINVGAPALDVAVRPDGATLAVAAGTFARTYDMAGKQQVEIKGEIGLHRKLAGLTEDQSVTKQLVGVADGKQKAADKTSKERVEAAKKAKTAKAAADKKVVDQKKKFDEAKGKSDTATKTAQQTAKTAADTKKAAEEATKKSTAAKKLADDTKKLAAEAAKKTTAATKAAADAKKAAEEAGKKLTAAQEAAKKAADDAAKKKAAEAVKAATDAKAAADKKTTDATKAAADAKKASDDAAKKSTDAAAASKTADEVKKKADAAVKPAQTKADAAKKAKDAADKETEKQKGELKKQTDAQASSDRTLKLADKASTDAQATLKQANAVKAQRDAEQKKVDGEVKAAQTADKSGEKPIRAVAFSADGKYLVTGGDAQLVHVWYGTSGAAVASLAGHKAAISALAVTSNGVVVSGAADKLAATWSLRPSWKLIGQLGIDKEKPLDVSLSPFVGRVLTVDFSQDGKWLVTGGGDPSRSGELMIWDVAKQTLVKEFKDAHSDTIFGAQFSRDGKQLLSGAADKFVKIFDVTTGKHVRSFEGHTHHVLDVSWKADNTSIASAGADNVIKVWNVDTGEQRRTIGGFSKQVTALRYVGIGDNLISCSGDKSVRYHTAGNGKNFRNFSGGADFMYAAASSRDETVVVAGGEDGVVRIWNGKDGKVIKTFEPVSP